jgi:hypothetical protein
MAPRTVTGLGSDAVLASQALSLSLSAHTTQPSLHAVVVAQPVPAEFLTHTKTRRLRLMASLRARFRSPYNALVAELSRAESTKLEKEGTANAASTAAIAIATNISIRLKPLG